jgi:hypothetical protein
MKKTSNSKKGTMPAGAPKGMNPLAYFNSLKAKAKAEPKQTLRKAQNGGTPFQSYMKIQGATPSDTSATNMYYANEATANKPILKNAYELTYGQDFGDSDTGNPWSKEELQRRRGSHSGYKDMNNPQRKTYENQISKYKQKQKKKGGVVKMQNGGYTVTNADGSPMTTPEGYRPPSVPSYPDFKKLRKTDPSNIAFMQLAKNPEEFDPKDVKKYGPKKPSRRMIREMSKESESAPMQTTPYKKGGFVKFKKK